MASEKSSSTELAAEIVKLFGEPLKLKVLNQMSNYLMAPSGDKVRTFEIGQSAAKLPTYNVGSRFNDCKAYHASGIYSLVPRESVL